MLTVHFWADQSPALPCVKFVQYELSTFQEFLIKDNSVSLHHRNMQFLAIELFKVISGNAPFLVNEIFTRRVIPENSVVANLMSQTDFDNYHNLRVFDLEQKRYVS